MGQAKRRGTFEDRRSAAIEDNARIIRLLKERENDWWDNLTPEEQEQVAKNRVKQASTQTKLGVLSGIAKGQGTWPAML